MLPFETVEMSVVARMSDQIRKLRTEKGWTQRELASRIGLTETAVMRLEKRRHGPRTLHTICKVLAAFDLAPNIRLIPLMDVMGWPESKTNLSPVRAMRQRAHLTQAQVAERANVHVTTVQRAERGLAMPETVQHILEVLQ